MEVYILDVLLQRMEVIDRFESLIWTERWASWGDFEIVIHSTPSNRSLLKSGTLLAMNLSHRVMVIENIENATSAEGIRMLKVKGRSIEAIFINRGARVSMGSLTASPTWDISDTPGGVMRKIVHDICAPTESTQSRSSSSLGTPTSRLAPLSRSQTRSASSSSLRLSMTR